MINNEHVSKKKNQSRKEKNNNQEEKLTKVVLNWYPGHMAKNKETNC